MNNVTLKIISVNSHSLRMAIPNGKVTSVLFLGLGQSGKNLQWVAEQAPEGMAVVEALPFMKVSNITEMESFGIACVKKACRSLQIHDYTIFAESQAAPAVAKAITEMTVTPKRLVFISPLGFNYDLFGANPSKRCAKLLHNSLKFWWNKDQSLRLSANRETLRIILSQSILKPRLTLQALYLAANQNVADIAEKLAMKSPVDIFTGTNDQHFPYSQVVQQLGSKTLVKIHELPAEGHCNRATPEGIRQLDEIVQLVSKT